MLPSNHIEVLKVLGDAQMTSRVLSTRMSKSRAAIKNSLSYLRRKALIAPHGRHGHNTRWTATDKGRAALPQ